MLRCIGCFAASLLVGSSLWAGELDSEFAAQPQSATTSPANAHLVANDASVPAASELDAESPVQAFHHFGGFHHGFGGFGRGFGYGGFGRGFGYGGWGFGRGWGVGRG